jgi:hypothetical protein
MGSGFHPMVHTIDMVVLDHRADYALQLSRVLRFEGTFTVCVGDKCP